MSDEPAVTISVSSAVSYKFSHSLLFSETVFIVNQGAAKHSSITVSWW
jgi:hypothetical protein